MQVFQYTDVKMSGNKKREENPPNCPIILQIKMRIEIVNFFKYKIIFFSELCTKFRLPNA